MFVPSWRKEQPRPDVPITGTITGIFFSAASFFALVVKLSPKPRCGSAAVRIFKVEKYVNFFFSRV